MISSEVLAVIQQCVVFMVPTGTKISSESSFTLGDYKSALFSQLPLPSHFFLLHTDLQL